MIEPITVQQLLLGIVCIALLIVRRPALSKLRTWLLMLEVAKCQAKADSLGFGYLFQQELEFVLDNAYPGDIFRLFGRVRAMSAQQGERPSIR